MKNSKNRNFFDNCGFDFIIYTTFISLFLARDLTPPEQDLLSNFFNVLGQNIGSIAAYCNDIEAIRKNSKDDNGELLL